MENLVEYTQFCGVIGRKCEPITGAVLSEFACWWFKKGTVMSKSLNTYLSCLNHELHNQGKGLDREREAVNCAHVLGGIRWVCHEMLGVEEGKQQRALTNEFCDEFIRQAETEQDAAIILICKHAVLRADNVTVNKNNHHVKIGDVHQEHGNVILTIPGSKTNQFGDSEEREVWHRCHLGPFNEDVDSLFCPACVCLKLVAKRKNFPKEALFLTAEGLPYTYSRFRRVLDSIARKLNLDPSYYRPHCCRRGGATDQMEVYQKSVEWIMIHNNWMSKLTVMKTYLNKRNPDRFQFRKSLLARGRSVLI